MIGSIGRRLLMSFCFALATFLCLPANAQDDVPAKDEVYKWLEQGGIDVTDPGEFRSSSTDLYVGNGPFPASLTFAKTYIGLPFETPSHPGSRIFRNGTYNFDDYLTCINCSTPTQINQVVVGGKVYRFSGFGTYTDAYRKGASLLYISSGPNGAYWDFHDPQGLEVIFPQADTRGCSFIDLGVENSFFCTYPSKYISPNGETASYQDNSQYDKYLINSRGYGLHFVLGDPATDGGYQIVDNYYKKRINSVKAFEYSCFPVTTGCYTGDLQSVMYTYDNANDLTSAAVGGKTTYYTYNSNPGGPFESKFLNGIKTPGDAVNPAITVLYVGSVTCYDHNSGFTGALGWADKLGHVTQILEPTECVPNLVTLQDALGSKSYYTFTEVNGPGVYVFGPEKTLTKVLDVTGATTLYGYDSYLRKTSETNPEGIQTLYTLDDRGNVTQAIIKAKPGSGLADIVTSAGYPATCSTSNYKTCNKPDYTIDANGNRKSYTWSTTYGGILSETTGLNSAGVCALAGGICPQTTYTYSSFTGVDGATFYLLTQKQEKLDATNVRTTTYGYDAAHHFAMKEVAVTAGGTTLRTCAAYDAVGNKISETKPRAGLSSCP